MLLALVVAATTALAQLREGIATAKTVAELKQRLAANPLVESIEERLGSPSRHGKLTWATIEVKLRKPIPVREFAAAMKWKRGYLVSTDVHQSTWHLRLWQKDLEPHYGPRISAVEPAVGRWVFPYVMVDDRPRGELPGVSYGPAPAYPIDRYDANVVYLYIDVLDRKRHRVAD